MLGPSPSTAQSGNEFVYGAGAILHADAVGEYWWGRRYATVLFVRPIPRSLWPSKYDDAAAVLGTPSIATNLGVGTDAFRETVGWTGATGAAPGLVADMWIEFWWASFFAILCLGWCYGRAWSRAVTHGGVLGDHLLPDVLGIDLLVMQSLEAMLFRFLLLALSGCSPGGTPLLALRSRPATVTRWRCPARALNAERGHHVPSPGAVSPRPLRCRRLALPAHRARALRRG